MSLDAEQLYRLLPAIYRVRDAEQGGPLRALIEVLAEQARVMEEDIERLHENWFIETCDEWVVPYIGDLLGVRGLHEVAGAGVFSRRGQVANTIRYRRRKGAATVLEQLAFDTSGWRARAVEFFELLGATQHYNHVRPHSLRAPDLRRAGELELIGTAFDSAAHTVDVRRIETRRGKHNIPNIGLFLWRIQSYFIQRVTARAVPAPGPGRYTFNPLGRDMQLFNRPQTETEITHLAEEINVAGPLRRRPLWDEVETRRQALADQRTPDYLYFDDRPGSAFPPVFQVFLNGAAVSFDEVEICNLKNWHQPADSKNYQRVKPDGSVETVSRKITVAVDAVLGRLSFPASVALTEPPRVSFAYGFSGDTGGGPYNRRLSLNAVLDREITWQVGVSRSIAPVAGEKIHTTMAAAVAEWNAQPPGTVGVIALMDNASYVENLEGADRIQVPEGSRLIIVAADWPASDVAGGLPGQKARLAGQLDADERRPHLAGNIEVEGTAAPVSQTPGELMLDGLLMEGKLTVLAGNLGRLRVAHCALLPDMGSLSIASDNARLRLELVRSICGPVVVAVAIAGMRFEDCILDNAAGNALEAPQSRAELERCTVFGKVQTRFIDAGNCIFNGPVTVERLQTGCARFCYVPPGSKTPRRFRCQPDLAASQAPPAEQAKVEARLVPSFTSVHHGHFAYAQLGTACPEEISAGAEDGSEMGAFSFLKQPQREANLRAALEEYLRAGLEAGQFFVT